MKTFLISIFSLITILANSQISVVNVAELRSNPALVGIPFISLLGYHKIDDGGGGLFKWVPNSTKAENNGTVIIPNWKTGAWERIEYDENVLNVRWFGAKADTSTDNRGAFLNCIKAARKFYYSTHIYSIGTIVIPAGVYRISDSINFDATVNIVGLGAGNHPRQEVQLWFDAHKPGFIFREYPNGSGAKNSKITNVMLLSRGAGPYIDKHGIWTNTRIICEAVTVYNFGGDGFRIDARYGGQPNLCVFRECEAYYNHGYGLSLWGYDANQCSFYDFNSHTNGMSNVHDESALGNNYYSLHSSYAGIRENYVKGYVNHKGHQYAAWRVHSGIEPGVHSNWKNFWVLADGNFSSLAYGNWHSDSTYYDAVAFWGMGPAASNNLYGAYTEGGQAGVALSGNSFWWGGTGGALAVTNTMSRAVGAAGRFQVYGGGVFGYYHDSKTDYAAFNNSTGLEIGTDRTKGGRLQHKWFGDTTIRTYANSFPVPSMYNPTWNLIHHKNYGRDTLLAATYVVNGMYGLHFSDANSQDWYNSRTRSFAMSDKAPTWGRQYAAGDFILNSGIDTTILGWKCIESGRPGKWFAIKICN
jgi:hypothetical protein